MKILVVLVYYFAQNTLPGIKNDYFCSECATMKAIEIIEIAAPKQYIGNLNVANWYKGNFVDGI